MKWTRLAPGTLAGLGLLLAGCSGPGSPRATSAAHAAEAFTAAAADRPGAACGLLAPGTAHELVDSSGSCAQGVTEAHLPAAGQVLDVQVYGLDAMVRLQDDTIFLALFDSGWRVTAAGCTAQEPERPYSCDVKGA